MIAAARSNARPVAANVLAVSSCDSFMLSSAKVASPLVRRADLNAEMATRHRPFFHAGRLARFRGTRLLYGVPIDAGLEVSIFTVFPVASPFENRFLVVG